MCCSDRVRRDGHTSAGTQRWRCCACGHRYTALRRPVRWDRRRIWFQRWLCEGYSIRQLVAQSGLSAWRLRQVIRYWLDHPPMDRRDLSAYRHLVVDGSFIYGRKVSAVVFIDAVTKAVVAGIYGLQEGEQAMVTLCRGLAQRGLQPISVTIDGNPQLYRMMRAVWPDVIIQRCLVHIRWQGQRWCRAHPPSPTGQHLRRLFARASTVRTPNQRECFLLRWYAWECRYGYRLDPVPHESRTQRDLRAARRMIGNALNDMFHFLDNPHIPSTTNAAEGFFGRLKQRYAKHRGLAKKRRDAYFAWYFYLCR